MITEAISELKDHWKDVYEKSGDTADGYFEIKNTRVVTIKNNDLEMFSDVQYIIEFELYTDYFGSAPYYEDAGVYDNVVVYKDGTMEVVSHLIVVYRSSTFEVDFSDFIQEIDDYNGYYNCVEKLH